MDDKIKAIIFDMGGVILRTDDYSAREATAKKLGLTEEAFEEAVFLSPSALAATIGKIDERQHWESVWQNLNVPAVLQPTYEEAFWAGDRLDENLVNFLREKKKSYLTALLSNAWSNARRSLTEKYPCMDAFDISIFSYKVGLAKPDPAIYRLILHRLGVKPTQAIFVDDNKDNILSAEALGIHAIQFKNTAQAQEQIDQVLKEHNGSYLNRP